MKRERDSEWGLVSMAAVALAAIVLALTPASIARAGFGGPSWGGSSPPFNGGTITQALTIALGMSLTPSGAGTGLIKSTTFNGAVRVGANGGIGSNVDETATTLVGYVGDNMSAGAGGNVLFGVYGSGYWAQSATQAPAACSAGTATVDPQSSVIIMDANAAACTLTVSTTTANTINQEGLPVRISAKNVGAGTLKLAATNFVSLPSRCTSTGMTAGQSALVAWSKDQGKWTFLGGCE
jgi:hypothetical protein